MKTVLLCSILFCAIALPLHAELSADDLEKIDKMIQSSESRIKEHVDIKFESVEKRLTLLSNIVIALVALIIVAVGLPQALMAWRNRETQQRIDSLKKEIETLKQQRVGNP